MSEHVIRWWPGEPEHPIIDELKARPGEWGLIWNCADGTPLGECEEFWACDRYPRVEVHIEREPGLITPIQIRASARWIPDDEWATRQGWRTV